MATCFTNTNGDYESSLVHAYSKAGADVCGEQLGHRCTNVSCCPFDDIEQTNNTRELCEEHGSSFTCCQQEGDCEWKELVYKGEGEKFDCYT